MSKENNFDKNRETASGAKFVFMNEGASDDGYGYENEQTVSVSDDVFYHDLAQDVLENNVQNKVAKDIAGAEVSEGFDETEDDDIPEISGEFVDEVEEVAHDDDVIEVSVGGGAYVNQYLNTDSAAESEPEELTEDEEVYNEEDDEAEDEEVYDEEDNEAEDEEVYDEEDDEAEDEEVYDEEDDEAEDEEVYDEEDDEAEDEEAYDREDDEDEEVYDEAEEVEDEAAYAAAGVKLYAAAYDAESAAVDDEPEDLYSVGEAEPAAVGKVDLMGYLSDEALSEIDSSFEHTQAVPEAVTPYRSRRAMSISTTKPMMRRTPLLSDKPTAAKSTAAASREWRRLPLC